MSRACYCHGNSDLERKNNVARMYLPLEPRPGVQEWFRAHVIAMRTPDLECKNGVARMLLSCIEGLNWNQSIS